MAVEPLAQAGELRKAIRELRRSVSNILAGTKSALSELNTRSPIESEYPGNTPGEGVEAMRADEYPVKITINMSPDGKRKSQHAEIKKDRELAQRWRERKYGWPLVLDRLNSELQEFWRNMEECNVATIAMPLDAVRALDQLRDGGNWMFKVHGTLRDLDDWCPITSPDGYPVRDFIRVLESKGLPPWSENVTALADYLGDLREICRMCSDSESPLYSGSANLATKSDTSHSPDFRSLYWYGETYSFTSSQAVVIRVLYESWELGAPDVGYETLLNAVDPEAPPSRLPTLFRDHPAWGTAIVEGGSKGSCRLKKPTKNT